MAERKRLNKECVMVLENLIREIHHRSLFNAHDRLDYVAAIRYAIAIIETSGASMSANDRQVTGKLDENTQKHYGFRKKY